MLDPDTLIHDRYRIVGLVGQGAMGAVYEAVDQRIGQPVALKQTLTIDAAAMGALEREALILAGLRHPALPVVSDTFSDPRGQFLAMSFVPGPNLAELLEQRGQTFAPAEVLAWADQILAALAYLHGQRSPVLHRDIKPQNLKLTAEGRVVLLDFGLARGAVFQTRLAGQRSVVGYTLPYAPIEQVRGQDTDPRSDLFALASTLYHLLTGAPPPDALERAAARIGGQADPLVSLRVCCLDLPAPAADALDRCLRLDPAGRIATADKLRRQLKLTAPRRAAPWRAEGWPSLWLEWAWPRRTIALTVILIAAALLIRAVLLRPAGADGQKVSSRGTITMTPGEPPAYTAPQVQTDTGSQHISHDPYTEVTCTKDGWGGSSAMATTWDMIAINCESGLQIFRTYDGQARVSFPYQAQAFTFSPNGSLFAMASQNNQVILWSRILSDPQVARVLPLDPDTTVRSLVFSPDGNTLAILYTSGSGVFIDVGNGLMHVDPLQNAASSDSSTIAFSADGRYFATGSLKGLVNVWEHVADEYRLISSRETKDLGAVTSLAFNAGDPLLLVGFEKGGVRRYRPDSHATPGAEVGQGAWHNAQVAVNQVDGSVVVGDDTGRLVRYREGGPAAGESLEQDRSPIHSIAFIYNGTGLVARTDHGFRVVGMDIGT